LFECQNEAQGVETVVFNALLFDIVLLPAKA
jgi:hypothetical protein